MKDVFCGCFHDSEFRKSSRRAPPDSRETLCRHCERSEAIHASAQKEAGLLRRTLLAIVQVH